MKKQLPLVLGLIVGFTAVVVFYIPAQWASEVEDGLLRYARILAAAAFVLGGINIVQVNWPKIRRRERDWQYKVVMLVTAAVMLSAGMLPRSADGPHASVSTARVAGLGGQSQLTVKGGDGATLVSIDGGAASPVIVDGKPVVLAVEPGAHTVRVFKGVAGYTEFQDELTFAAGQQVRVDSALAMTWGKSGRVFTWLYDHVFDPCNATMFALLAFFIASAAFRAFRARNTEAALLLGAAILVMLGRVPIGRAISEVFPLISDWLVDVPNNAGRRAIMMGAALGAVVTGLRVILGLERSHLGAD